MVLTRDFITLEPLEERHFDGILTSVRDPSRAEKAAYLSAEGD